MSAIRRTTLGVIVLGLLAAAGPSPVSEAGSRERLSIRDVVPPSAPTLLRVTDTSRTSISISWRAASDNVRVRNYVVFVNGTSRDTTNQTRFNVRGLTCGKAYTLGVAAADPAGNRSAVAEIVASTSACPVGATPAPAPDTQAPTTPDGLAVTGSTSAQLNVSWKPATDNVAVASYGVYRDGTSVGSTASTDFSFTGLACGTTYALAVDAVDAAGNRSAKASVSAQTGACPDTSPPTTPSLLATSNVSGTAATLTWAPSVDKVGVARYGIYLGGNRLSDSSANLAAYTITGLTCGTSYAFGVDAFDAAGNRSTRATLNASTSPCADTTPPSAPSGLNASSITDTGLTFGWSASTDNVGVTTYVVYRNGSQVGQTSTTSYSVSGLTCGTAYTLAVEARDAAGNASSRPSVNASTSACPVTPPSLAALRFASPTADTLAGSVAWEVTSPVAVNRIDFRIDGGAARWTEYTGPYMFNGDPDGRLDTTALSNGSHTLTADGYDAGGTKVATASKTVTVSNSSTTPPPPPPPTGPTPPETTPSPANVFVSTTGNDATCARGDQAKPCLTISKAYSLATGGDTIEVACGTYGAQTVPARSIGTSVVTIRKASGCDYVTLTGSMHIRSSYVTVDGFSTTNNTTIWVDVPNGVSTCSVRYVTIQNFRASGVGGGCDHITFRYGDVGTNHYACNGGPEDGIQTMGPTSTGQWADLIPPTYILVDHVIVHDTSGFVGCGSHTDGWQSFGCQHCTIRNSTFMNNDTADIIIYQITGASTDIQDILVENNSFGAVKNPGHGVSIGGSACLADQPNNVIVQNNTFYSGAVADINCVQGKKAGTFRNNVMASGAGGVCSWNLAFDYNTFSSGGCGAHYRTCKPAFVDEGHSNGNVNLAASDTCARDYVPSSTGAYPPTDMHGNGRPAGGAVDAGANESG
jgi:chitodextrinase